MITSIFRRTRNFPDSKEFARNQFKADQLVVNTLPLLYNKYSKTQVEAEEMQEKKTGFIASNSEFLAEDGFTPDYRNDKKNRQNVLYATPFLSGLSVATGLYIIFGLNIFGAILIGLTLAYTSFYLALLDKVLESEDRMKWTFLLFLAVDAVLLIVGMFIGISNEVPSVYLYIHVIFCSFALLINFSMIKHAENYNQDKVRAYKKDQLDAIKNMENKLLADVSRLRTEISRLVSELGSYAVTLRAGFVAHNYDPSTLRMSLDTRIAVNQFFGYDLFPVIDAIVAPDYVWERRAITKWNEDTNSKYPEILSEYGPFSSTATFTAPPANRQIGNTPTNQILNEVNPVVLANSSNLPGPMNNATVFQSPESENEL